MVEGGIISNVGAGNIGSITGTSFALHTGAAYHCANICDLHAFADRGQQLAEVYGERFCPPVTLLKRAEKNELFNRVGL